MGENFDFSLYEMERWAQQKKYAQEINRKCLNVWRELTWSVNVCRILHRMALFVYGIRCRYWKKRKEKVVDLLYVSSFPPFSLFSLHLSFLYFSSELPSLLSTLSIQLDLILCEYFKYVGKVSKCLKTYCKWDECQGNWFVCVHFFLWLLILWR